MLKVGLPAGVPAHLQRTQKGRLKAATPATLHQSYGQGQLSKHCRQVPEMLTITSLTHLAPTAQSTLRVPSLEVPPQSLSGLTGVDLWLTQPITDQIIVAPQDLLQYLKHQMISHFLKPINNLVQGHLTNCNLEELFFSNFRRSV
jgi:hypothetical protein